MKENKLQLCILAIVAFGLVLGSFFVVTSTLPTSPQEKDGDPESAMPMDVFDRDGAGTNIGVLSNASLRMNNYTSDAAGAWSQPLVGGQFFSSIIQPRMPRAISGTSWGVDSAQVIVSGLRNTQNWWTSAGFTAPTRTSDSYTWTDNYWHPTNQSSQTLYGYAAAGTGTNPTVAGSVAFSTGTSAYYFRYQNAARYYGFNPNQGTNRGAWYITGTNLVAPTMTQMGRSWGFSHGSTTTWYHRGGSNTGAAPSNWYYGYPSNHDNTAGSTAGITTAESGWAYGNNRVNSITSVTASATANSQGWYETQTYAQRFVRLWYSAAKPGSLYDFKTVAQAFWDREVKYQTVGEQSIYFTNDGTGRSAHQALFSSTISFSNYLAPKSDSINTDGFSGYVAYSLVKPDNSVASLGSTAFDRNTNFGSGAAFSASDLVLTEHFVLSGLYKMRVTVEITAKVSGSRSVDGTILANGARGTSVLDYGRNPSSGALTDYHQVGITVRVTGANLRIYDDIPLYNPKNEYVQPNGESKPNGVWTIDGDMRVFYQTALISFNERAIPSDGVLPKVQFDYMVHSDLMGYSAGNAGLTARMAAWIQVYKSGSWTILEKPAGIDFSQIRNLNNAGWGVGCHRFEWELSAAEIAVLNGSSSFKLLIGYIAPPTFELDYPPATTNARVWFKNIDFTFTSIPTPVELNMKLNYKRGSDTFTTLETSNFQSFDGGLTATAVLSGTNLRNYLRDSQLDGMYISSDFGSLSMNYQLNLNISYENWDFYTKFIFTNTTKSHFESNITFLTPHPVTHTGVRWYDSSVVYSYNDNFNITIIIPKFTSGGQTYWMVEKISDKNFPTATWPEMLVPAEYWTDDGRRYNVFRDTSPPTYGVSAYTNTKIQAVRMDILLYRSYTGSVWGRTLAEYKDLYLDMHFSCPNTLNNIQANSSISFSTHKNLFLRTEDVYMKANFLETVTSASSTGGKVLSFYILNDTTNLVGFYAQQTFGSSETFVYAPGFYDLSGKLLGSAYSAMAVMNVTDIGGTSRSGGARYLGGIYRGGLAHQHFGVLSTTTLSPGQHLYANAENAPSTNELEIRNSNEGTEWDASYTNYFDTPNQGNNRIYLNFTYKDDEGTKISGATTNIKAYYYSDAGYTYKRRIQALSQTLSEDGDGNYYFVFNPHESGNIPKGYIEWEVSFQKNGFISQNIAGNFSVAIISKLQIKSPVATNYYYIGGQYYHHAEGSEFSDNGGKAYNAGMVYRMEANLTNDLGTQFFTNKPGSYYQTHVFMTYNLTSVRRSSDGVLVNLYDYVNYTWFMENGYDDITNASDLNPVNGTFQSGNNNDFTADFQWPAFESNYQNVSSISAWQQQVGETPQYFLHHYNVAAKIRVNRTGFAESEAGSYFQPNDVVYVECLPVDPKADPGWDGLQRQTTMRLMGSDGVNFTRIIPTNFAIDNTPFAMGTFNLDESNIMNFYGDKYPEADKWNYKFELQNYQNNLTQNADRFRIRVMVNCSTSNLLEKNQFLVGWNDAKFIPVGPINKSTVMYGQTMSNSSLTLVKLAGWYDNGSDIILGEDVSGDLPNWSTTVNTTGTPFTAYGVYYVSDWIYWNSTSVGNKELTISVTKDGFSDSYITATAKVLSAPTAILNGSMTDPIDEVDGIWTYDTINMETYIAEPVSFLMNFTDKTSYGTLPAGVRDTSGIEGAQLSIIGGPERFTLNISNAWGYEEKGNGIYNITIFNTNFPYADPATPEWFNVTFSATKANYNSGAFILRVDLKKRECEVQVIETWSTNSTLRFPEHKNANPDEALSITTLKAVIRFLDEVSGTYVNFSLEMLDSPLGLYRWNGTQFMSSKGYFTSIVHSVYEGQPAYNITFYQAISEISRPDYIGAHQLSINLTKMMNYTDTAVNFTFDVLRRTSDVLTIETNVVKEFYPLYSGNPLQTNFPVFEMIYRDVVFNPTLIYEKDWLTITSNFTNPNRLGETLHIFGTNPENGAVTVTTDISSLSVGDYNVNFTVEHPDYYNISYVVTFTITEASTTIDAPPFVRSREQTSDLSTTIAYASGITIQWGYWIYLLVPYQYNDKLILDDAFGNVDLSISGLTASGIEIFLEPSTNNLNYLYLKTNVSTSETRYINFTINIGKDNFQSKTFNISIYVTDRLTAIEPDRTALTEVSFRGKLTMDFYFFDSGYNDRIVLDDAILYTETEEISVEDGFGYYNFSNQLAYFTYEAFGETGKYRIRLDTTNLTAGQNYVFSVHIGKESYVLQSFIHNFTVQPTKLRAELWLMRETGLPDTERTNQKNIAMLPDEIKFHFWLKAYVEIITISGTEKLYLDGNDVSVQLIFKDDAKLDDNNQSIVIRVIDMAYDADLGFFYAEITLKWQSGLDEMEFGQLNSVIVNLTSSNPNYQSGIEEATVVVVKSSPTLPGWFYIVLGVTVGAAVGMGSYGIKQMLKWRIPYVLRMIDESIEKIKDDKFPPVGVMTGRSEFIINCVIDYLDEAGIVWSISDKFEEGDDGDIDEEEGEVKTGKALSHEEIVAALGKIESLSADERALFIEELKRMDRKAQDEFIESLKED